MSTETTVRFKNVSKKFKRGRKLLLKEALIDIFKPGKTESFWALKNITFSLERGTTLGIIGTNGTGKSTILKLIAGVMYPDDGEVYTKGTIAPLIELGAGFHFELSGRENVYLNGTIMGLSKKEIDERFDSIVNFAELEDFIDTPIKHYSSGMYMRLGFSVAVHTNPDILVVDEILSVGDARFQKKSLKKMESFKKSDRNVVFVSHNMKSIKNFCDRVIYLKDSKIVMDDKPEIVVRQYKKDMDAK